MAKVLILDDDEAIVEGLTMALNDEGLGVVSTTSPFELPFLLRRDRPDVVLIDLAMPALRGERVFEALSPSLRGDIRFLVFSGCAATDLAATAAEVGADDFIYKGDDFGAIVRRIKFWGDNAHGDRASRLEPHVAVITESRLSEAAAVLRAGGYFVTLNRPGELPPPDADAIVIDAPRAAAQHAWSSLCAQAVNITPVIVVTNMSPLFVPALTLAPRSVADNLITVVDGALAHAQRSAAIHCIA
jgi:CheY-like chemotaxis protein